MVGGYIRHYDLCSSRISPTKISDAARKLAPPAGLEPATIRLILGLGVLHSRHPSTEGPYRLYQTPQPKALPLS